MSTIEFPTTKIKPSLPGDPVAAAERDIHGAAADLMLAAKDMRTLDEVLAAVRKLTGMRAALDSAASFLLARAEELSRE
jgi:hypothetical protein